MTTDLPRVITAEDVLAGDLIEVTYGEIEDFAVRGRVLSVGGRSIDLGHPDKPARLTIRQSADDLRTHGERTIRLLGRRPANPLPTEWGSRVLIKGGLHDGEMAVLIDHLDDPGWIICESNPEARAGYRWIIDREIPDWEPVVEPEPLPGVRYLGSHGSTDAEMFATMAHRLEHGYSLEGPEVRSALVRLIRREIARAEA